MNAWLAIGTLWIREMVRFYRQPSRVVGALGTPFVFWLLIGSGIGKSFRMTSSSVGLAEASAQLQSTGYLAYFFPGTILMILLFTAIFSTISLIEDRREGFLQSVLVAPIGRSSLVLGKILGGTTLAFFQGMIFLCFAPWIGINLSFFAVVGSGFVIFLNGFALTGLGFIIAWRLHSIQGFHAIMNLFLMPLWMLSGALFPIESAPAWIRIMMKLNPMTYCLASLRHTLYGGDAGLKDLPSFSFSIGVTVLFGAVIFVASVILASWRRAEHVA